MNRDEMFDGVRARTKPWDIIVIGGGATGVGCAVDAASRGLAVLLLERHDFGKGTSSRSTKLIHGGVRYLAQGNISLVREALRERAILLRNAPHVVHKQVFIIPCFSLWQKIFYGSGLKIYDLLAGKYRIGRSQLLTKSKTLEYLPTLKPKLLSGGILYYDAQFDDTRLLLDLTATACEHGAVALNYAGVSGLTKNAFGKVDGVEFEDRETGEPFIAAAKCVINATGVFCDDVRKMSDATSKPLVTLSQGVHLVLDRSFLPSDAAVMIPKTIDGRVLFCIPWHGHTLVGTTDTPISETDPEPAAQRAEIDFILEMAGNYLRKQPTREDILSVFAGIRPLVRSDAAKNTASISRGHTIEVDRSQLITITGGKWTTYRRMAEDAIDTASRIAGLDAKPSQTQSLTIKKPAEPFLQSNKHLHPELPYTGDDVVKAVREEIARTVEDVLARRTRALFLNANAAIEMAPAVAIIVAIELNKNVEWIESQIKAFE
ncbi:MAG: glycerol-3-phosphate dehydrogenase/oxidase, partial [Pyrinomonadaceae bacterium]